MKNLNKYKIAIVCDWLTNMGGAEKVVLAMHKLFPDAPIFTSTYNPKKVKGFEKAKIITSWIQNIPYLRRKHQFTLSLLPQIFENFDLDDFDIVISSSHSCAKGIIVKPETLHVCYCHSPMRYAWDGFHKYIKEYNINPIIKMFVPYLMHRIRLWDKISSERTDLFIANSNYIKKRIEKYYRKEAKLIYPFYEEKKYKSNQKENFFLAVGRIIPYKKFDLLVEAFNELPYKLLIAGTGDYEKKIKKIAKKNITFLGFVEDEKLLDLYSKAKALIFPQCEDFGIIPLEAMKSGCPVIAYKKGGALETVKENVSGHFFEKQDKDTLKKAVYDFMTMSFDENKIIKQAEKFSEEIFRQNLLNYLDEQSQIHFKKHGR